MGNNEIEISEGDLRKGGLTLVEEAQQAYDRVLRSHAGRPQAEVERVLEREFLKVPVKPHRADLRDYAARISNAG